MSILLQMVTDGIAAFRVRKPDTVVELNSVLDLANMLVGEMTVGSDTFWIRFEQDPDISACAIIEEMLLPEIEDRVLDRYTVDDIASWAQDRLAFDSRANSILAHLRALGKIGDPR